MELLKTLYKIYSPTGHEWPMIKFIREYLTIHVPHTKVAIDSWGNLYITKCKDRSSNISNIGFPTLCCHIDQAQKIHSEDFEVKSREGGKELYGWSESRQDQEGLGADDKNGIWICLKALEYCNHLKVFMAVGEEKGCWGSNRADISFFEDSLYILEPDCKGGEEIRTLLRGVPVASKEFEKALEAEKFGYVITEGKTTDILPLTLSGVGVSCANIPCGYQNPHKDNEYCIVAEVKKCHDYIIHLVNSLNKKFPHEFKTETRKIIETFKSELIIK